MTSFFEKLIASGWNRLNSNKGAAYPRGGTDLGHQIHDGVESSSRISIGEAKRCQHTAVLGKTGQGKSSIVRYLALQDIERQRGLVSFDLHNETTQFLLRALAAAERRWNRDLSEKVIVIEPGDPDYSIGFNVLEPGDPAQSFVQIGEFAQILKQRWHLESFGARTEELLRNSLHLLSDNHLTLLELAPLLTNAAFRTVCLAQARNAEVRAYFRDRFDQASDAMQAVFRDAILNKISAFTGDPRFRHLVGQRQSTVSLVDAMDRGAWVIINLDKGRLGDQAITLGALILTKLKNGVFARRRRDLYTFYCDEIQNLVTFDSGLDTLLSEARKFGIGVVSANQFLQQYPPAMRAAILSVGTHIFFQLSSEDAEKMSSAVDGGKKLAELLKNLPQRHFVAKSGHYPWQHGVVPNVVTPDADFADLYRRARARWARPRLAIEQDIRRRYEQATQNANEALHGWD